MLTETMRKRLENDFTYHAPFGDQVDRYKQIRDKALEFALLIADLTPASREQSVALTYLDACTTAANSAISRNEKPIE